MHQSTLDMIQRRLHITDNHAASLGVELLLHFLVEFKDKVWMERCRNMIQWEVAHGIRTKDKHSKAPGIPLTRNQDNVMDGHTRRRQFGIVKD